MSVVVVAILTPKAGRVQEVLDAYAVVSPLVHAEAGCELYAVHTDDQLVILVERWTTQDDLDRHANGDPLRRLGSLIDDALERPYDAFFLRNLPFGEPVLGTIQ